MLSCARTCSLVRHNRTHPEPRRAALKFAAALHNDGDGPEGNQLLLLLADDVHVLAHFINRLHSDRGVPMSERIRDRRSPHSPN